MTEESRMNRLTPEIEQQMRAQVAHYIGRESWQKLLAELDAVRAELSLAGVEVKSYLGTMQELTEENARLRAELDQSERQVAVFQRSASDANLKVDELEQQLDATREALSLALVEVRSYLTELARHEDEKMNNPKGDREYLRDLLVASEETRQAILDSIKDERSMNNAKYDLVGTRLLKSIVATQVWLASQEPSR